MNHLFCKVHFFSFKWLFSFPYPHLTGIHMYWRFPILPKSLGLLSGCLTAFEGDMIYLFLVFLTYRMEDNIVQLIINNVQRRLFSGYYQINESDVSVSFQCGPTTNSSCYCKLGNAYYYLLVSRIIINFLVWTYS